MSNHWIEYSRQISDASINLNLKLNPEHFLECEDEIELEEAIYDIIARESDLGDVEIFRSEHNLEMEDFLNEWKSLKDLK